MLYLNAQDLPTSLMLLMGPAVALTAHAEVYLSATDAAQVLFPNQIFKKTSFELKEEEKIKIESLTDTKIKSNKLSLFTSKNGDIVFIDQVIGKHEFITYALGINKNGKIQGVEILEYRESYGHQIRRESWRKQFIGKDKTAALQINQDIKNLSGATLSSTHVTNGVRRILQTYEQIKTRL